MVPTDEAIITRQMLYSAFPVPATRAAFAIVFSIYCAVISLTSGEHHFRVATRRSTTTTFYCNQAERVSPPNQRPIQFRHPGGKHCNAISVLSVVFLRENSSETPFFRLAQWPGASTTLRSRY